jgi:hypothetical protein
MIRQSSGIVCKAPKNILSASLFHGCISTGTCLDSLIGSACLFRELPGFVPSAMKSGGSLGPDKKWGHCSICRTRTRVCDPRLSLTFGHQCVNRIVEGTACSPVIIATTIHNSCLPRNRFLWDIRPFGKPSWSVGRRKRSQLESRGILVYPHTLQTSSF